MNPVFSPRRAKRTIVFVAAFAASIVAVLGAYLALRLLGGDVPHRHASGERIDFAGFQPNDYIVVKTMHGDRGVRVREYRFYWAGGALRVDILGNTPESEYDSTQKLANGRALRGAEAEGLDAMVRYFRRRRDELSGGVGEYRISYFRENREIGEEFFVGYQLPRELIFYAQEKKRGQPVDAADYARLAEACDITAAELKLLFPFEFLEIYGEGGLLRTIFDGSL